MDTICLLGSTVVSPLGYSAVELKTGMSSKIIRHPHIAGKIWHGQTRTGHNSHGTERELFRKNLTRSNENDLEKISVSPHDRNRKPVLVMAIYNDMHNAGHVKKVSKAMSINNQAKIRTKRADITEERVGRTAYPNNLEQRVGVLQ